MNCTKYEHTHAAEDRANRSHKKIGITFFIQFNMVDLFWMNF
jgi:hypothetical protein